MIPHIDPSALRTAGDISRYCRLSRINQGGEGVTLSGSPTTPSTTGVPGEMHSVHIEADICDAGGVMKVASHDVDRGAGYLLWPVGPFNGGSTQCARPRFEYPAIASALGARAPNARGDLRLQRTG
ncbi:hypothetical protein GCM10022226_20840 [Sphaerisporangium flaviroseum]|uniref:Uncharacterized protein n=1 Tax=Sphaerisporangium flaviroseum TaxID=509199 RepID=A0ABP7HP88_9ACTN